MDHGPESSTPFGAFVDSRAKKLSPQLRRVFVLLGLSFDDDAIGLILKLRRSTVRHYIERVLLTLGLSSRSDVPLMYLIERTPDLRTDLRGFFDATAFERVSKVLSKRTMPTSAEL